MERVGLAIHFRVTTLFENRQNLKLHKPKLTFQQIPMRHHFACELDPDTQTFAKRPFAVANLEPGQVLIEVICCTICGSDLHTFCGRRAAPASCVLGHEIIGRVTDWGGASPPLDFYGNPIAVGQRVTWAMAVGCGDCFFCRNQLSQKCESLFKYGHERGGAGTPTGGLSQICLLVTGTPIFPIPAAMPDEVACPANCATATVCAAMRLVAHTHAIEGSVVLVNGAGMLGLTAAAWLSEAQAAAVVVVDVSQERLEQAKLFGATHCVAVEPSDQAQVPSDPAQGSSPLATVIAEVTGGRGVDIALDFAGSLAAVEAAVVSTRVGGCVLLAGSVFPTLPLSLSPESLVRRMLTIRGLHNYLPSDLDSALQFLERVMSRFPLERLVSKSFSLEQTQAAFEFARDARPVRVAIRP